jgi:uncharacterized protein YlxW (UPF0749 family)
MTTDPPGSGRPADGPDDDAAVPVPAAGDEVGTEPESDSLPVAEPVTGPAAEPAAELAAEPAAEPEVLSEPGKDVEVPEPPAATADDVPAEELPASPVPARRRSRDPLAAALIGVLTLLLGFAFAVQVRSVGDDEKYSSAREEDLVRILDDLNAREERLRGQIADQRSALTQLSDSDSQLSTALEEARARAQAIGILNGTLPAKGPGLVMTIHDPDRAIRVADLLDAIEELRGAGGETMQIGGIRVGVSTAVTGAPGSLLIDGHPITAPYELRVIGSPQDMETAMNIPGGVVPRVTSLGGSVDIVQSQDVVVDALRPLDTPQYAQPDTGN